MQLSGMYVKILLIYQTNIPTRLSSCSIHFHQDYINNSASYEWYARQIVEI